MSNNPTAICHYKLLIDSIKFQLTNILPDGATVVVMEMWGKEFVQTWVSCALLSLRYWQLCVLLTEGAWEQPPFHGVDQNVRMVCYGLSTIGCIPIGPVVVVERNIPAEHCRTMVMRARGKEVGCHSGQGGEAVTGGQSGEGKMGSSKHRAEKGVPGQSAAIGSGGRHLNEQPLATFWRTYAGSLLAMPTSCSAIYPQQS